jgi:hypothetical protein
MGRMMSKCSVKAVKKVVPKRIGLLTRGRKRLSPPKVTKLGRR